MRIRKKVAPGVPPTPAPAQLEGVPFTCSGCGTPSTRIVLSGNVKRPDLCGGCWARVKT